MEGQVDAILGWTVNIVISTFLVVVGYGIRYLQDNHNRDMNKQSELSLRCEELVKVVTDNSAQYFCQSDTEHDRKGYCVLISNDLKRLSGLIADVGQRTKKDDHHFFTEFNAFHNCVTSPPFNNLDFNCMSNDCEKLKLIRNNGELLRKKLRDVS